MNPTIAKEHMAPVLNWITRHGRHFRCGCPVRKGKDYSNAYVTVATKDGVSRWRVRCKKHQRLSARLAMRKRRSRRKQ